MDWKASSAPQLSADFKDTDEDNDDVNNDDVNQGKRRLDRRTPKFKSTSAMATAEPFVTRSDLFLNSTDERERQRSRMNACSVFVKPRSRRRNTDESRGKEVSLVTSMIDETGADPSLSLPSLSSTSDTALNSPRRRYKKCEKWPSLGGEKVQHTQAAQDSPNEDWWSSFRKPKTTGSALDRRGNISKSASPEPDVHLKELEVCLDRCIKDTQTTMNKETVEKMVRDFMDRGDKHGKVDFSAFSELMSVFVSRNLGLQLRQRLYELFQQQGKKQGKKQGRGGHDDDKLTVIDFVKGVDAMLKGGVKDHLDFFFNLMDLDGDGRVTTSEFLKVYRSVEVSKMKSTNRPVDSDELYKKTKAAAAAFHEMCDFLNVVGRRAIQRKDFAVIMETPRFAIWFEDIRDDLPTNQQFLSNFNFWLTPPLSKKEVKEDVADIGENTHSSAA